MCNTCCSSVYNGNTNTCRNACGYCNTQRMCRDCCGNIIVYNPTSCGCGCGNNTTTGNAQNGNGNGSYRCFVICGNMSPVAQNTATPFNGGDAYYAAQYGLGRCGCPYVYNNND